VNKGQSIGRLFMITALILLAAIGILTWGFFRVRPYGKLGILAWLQSVVLMAPWLLFFGLFAAGIYLNLAGVLVLVVSSTGLYILLGRQLRTMGKADLQAQRLANLASEIDPKLDPTSPAQSTETSSTETNASGSSATPGGASSRKAKPEAVPVALADCPIPSADLTKIEGIFGIDTFFRTETIPYDTGALFKGNLRGKPDTTIETLNALLEDRLPGKYRLFLIDGYEGRPVVVALTREQDPQPATVAQKILAVVLALATVATSLQTGALIQNFDFFENPQRFAEALPIALGVLAVLGIHDLAHWWQAKRYGIQLTPPFLIPAWQLGSFGAFTRFASILPNRSVLFDISFAGPAAGGLLSVAFLLVGLVLSHPGSAFQIPAEFFKGSVLVGALAKVVLGSALQADLVDVHPLTIIGWLGLVITALNVMPAGSLDGGRIVKAIYGRKVAGRTTVVTLIVLALVALANPLALYWLVLIGFLQRNAERACTDDVTEPDDARAALGLLILFLMLATLMPLAPALAGRLGIGA
jgi:membrane-associated protease RseP (regulator of RpoE activity)